MISQGGCTNPLKCHGTLSCTSLNKSYFYPGVGSHYLHAFLHLPKLFKLAILLKNMIESFLRWEGKNLPSKWALIINSLHIYKGSALAEQRRTSASSLSSANASRSVLSSSSCRWERKDWQRLSAQHFQRVVCVAG